MVLTRDWDNALQAQINAPYFARLMQDVDREYDSGVVYPPRDRVFAAFRLADYHTVKVVIIGQDPYHNAGQANGLCFAVDDGSPLPPSLRNILNEMSSDVGVAPTSGNLEYLARQGVLMLNAILTVRQGSPLSHQGLGWERFTDSLITSLNCKDSHIVYLLWGNYAINKAKLIDASKHSILTAPHPSPLSAYRGFVGCKHFGKTNSILASHGLSPVQWAE